MNPWLKNSVKNLLPLSLNQTSFEEATKEWEWNGEWEDYETASEICELCENEGLRYHFTIVNVHTKNEINVGSSCIDRFNITVRNTEGVEVTEGKAAYLEKYVKIERRKKSLYELYLVPESTRQQEFQKGRNKGQLDDYCIKNIDNIDARMLNYLFIRFEEENIKFDPKSFSIDIRTNDSKNKLLKLNKEQFDRIKKALSPNQQTYYLKNKVSY